MKQIHGKSLIFGVAAFAFLAAQPVWAQTTEITGVELNPVDGGVNVVLKTSAGSRPQVFTTKRGNALVADIINTQLRLPEGNSFRHVQFDVRFEFTIYDPGVWDVTIYN